MTLRTDVSVLYVDPRGPYPKLVADWWDEARDAKLYAGPNPVVAHPPCGPWGSMASLSHHQDPECARVAVRQVRRWGGVLEHPVGSRLWIELALPEPWGLSDSHGGRTIRVDQVSWGHACQKPTWLYMVGIDSLEVRTGGKPTHQIRARHNGAAATEPYKMASKEIRRRTPLAFAEWLIELASQARR